jgi:glycosyltransferase involved in cell wall biosynthesis
MRKHRIADLIMIIVIRSTTLRDRQRSPEVMEGSRLDILDYFQFEIKKPRRKYPGPPPLILSRRAIRGGTDETLQVLRQIERQLPARIQVLQRPVNSGKAEAVPVGMLHALEGGAADFVGFWDADLATPLDAINDLLELLLAHKELDIVLGSRVKLLGRDIERLVVRHYLGRVFATCASVVLGLPIYDTQCGAKIFRVTPDLAGILQEPFSSRWIFDVELLARFLHLSGTEKAHGEIYEFPLYRWRDVPGSKVGPLDFLTAAKELLAIWRKYPRNSRHETIRPGEGGQTNQTQKL